jgi:hypothetical protein
MNVGDQGRERKRLGWIGRPHLSINCPSFTTHGAVTNDAVPRDRSRLRGRAEQGKIAGDMARSKRPMGRLAGVETGRHE